MKEYIYKFADGTITSAAICIRLRTTLMQLGIKK